MLFLTSIVGAKWLYLISNLPYISFSLSNIVSFRGGLSFIGAIALSACFVCIYARLAKIDFCALVDYGAPFFLLSQAFARIGCLMAGCCYGKAVDLPVGVVFKTVDGIPRYPVQGYEAVFLLAIYVITRIVYEKERRSLGETSFISLFLYGSGRFIIEFFRDGSPVLFANITFMQVVFLILALGSAIAIIRINLCKGSYCILNSGRE